MSKLHVIDDRHVTFWCPGCNESHQIDTSIWEFNGDHSWPTFSPSYLTWLDPNPNAKPELSEAEKASDMERVDRYWPLIEAYTNADRDALLDRLAEKAKTCYDCVHDDDKYIPLSVIEAERSTSSGEEGK